MVNNQKKITLKKILYSIYHLDRGRFLAEQGKRFYHLIWGDKPVSLKAIKLLSIIIPKSKQVNGLFITNEIRYGPGALLRHPKLSNIFKTYMLGGWALDVETINFLEGDIKNLKPKKILEFGSGVSTVCLAQFLLDIYGFESDIRVYSIEQDEKYAKESAELIQQQGYSEFVKVLHCPLIKKDVEGIDCYTYDIDQIREVLDEHKFDYCLIDGPSVPNFDGRFATLPSVKKYLSKETRFFLDDALRSNELSIAQKWVLLPYIHVQGIVLTRKGILTGFVRS